MQGAEEILSISFLVVLGIEFVACIKKLISAYSATLGDGKFNYRFKKTRIPAFILTLFTLASASFIYGLVISQQSGLALGFCAATSTFGGLGLFMVMCFTPIEEKASNRKKPV